MCALLRKNNIKTHNLANLFEKVHNYAPSSWLNWIELFTLIWQAVLKRLIEQEIHVFIFYNNRLWKCYWKAHSYFKPLLKRRQNVSFWHFWSKFSVFILNLPLRNSLFSFSYKINHFLDMNMKKSENKNGNCGQCLNPQTMYQINIKMDL